VARRASQALGARAAETRHEADELYELETPSGWARAHLKPVSAPKGALVLGHGAGGGVGAADLVAVTQAAQAEDLCVALVEQPYRVAGKRSPAPAHQLDAAWIAVIAGLRAGSLGDLLLIVGGRSAGARIACRTAAEVEAAGVLCLAFPLIPPARAKSRAASAMSRLPELDQVKLPMLVIQGADDPFGVPPSRRGRKVVQVPGDHSLRRAVDSIGSAVRPWLRQVIRRSEERA
jgi:predicted alpha/beta-hydrolase family hydrolase